MKLHPSLDLPKRRGEWVELLFAAKAVSLGFTVVKPWGDTSRYDFALEKSGIFLRVQVKSTYNLTTDKTSYQCKLDIQGIPYHYHSGNVDFLAIYIIPEDVWYILPVQLTEHIRSAITLAPNIKGHKYEPSKEAWHLLDQFITDRQTQHFPIAQQQHSQ